MAASVNDLFQKLGSASSLVNTPKVTATRAAAGTTLTVDTCNWDTTTGKTFATYQVDTSGNVVSGSEIIWKGVVNSSTSIGSLARIAGASDTGSAIGDYVELLPASAWANNIVAGILTQHNQDGTHGAVTATSVTTSAGITNTGALTTTGATTLNGSWDGWVGANETWAFASASTITVPTDATTKYDVGDYIKLTQSSTVKIFVITSLTATVLTVAGLGGATVANSAITLPAYSKARTPRANGLNGGLPFNPYKFSVIRAAAANSGNNAYAKVVFDTVKFDTGTNVASGTFTAPVAGFYQLNWGVNFPSASVASAIAALYKNGAAFRYGNEIYASGAAGGGGTGGSSVVQSAANDTWEVYVYAPVTNAMIVSPVEGAPYFNGFLVSAI